MYRRFVGAKCLAKGIFDYFHSLLLFYFSFFRFNPDDGIPLKIDVDVRILRRFPFYKSVGGDESIEGKCGSPIGFHFMRESAPKKLRSRVAYCTATNPRSIPHSVERVTFHRESVENLVSLHGFFYDRELRRHS